VVVVVAASARDGERKEAAAVAAALHVVDADNYAINHHFNFYKVGEAKGHAKWEVVDSGILQNHFGTPVILEQGDMKMVLKF
jgi:hypothetical protein